MLIPDNIIQTEIAHAMRIGVKVVQTSILAQSCALVGAQSPEVRMDAIRRVAQELAG